MADLNQPLELFAPYASQVIVQRFFNAFSFRVYLLRNIAYTVERRSGHVTTQCCQCFPMNLYQLSEFVNIATVITITVLGLNKS